MADPNLSQAAWNAYWERFGVLAGMENDLEVMRQRFSEEKVRAVNRNDKNGNFSAGTLSLSGAKVGTNTSADGRLYVRLVANSANWDLHLYTAVSASGEVGQALDVADGAVATIVEANSSGLTGSVTLDASVVAEADDVHYLQVYPDYRLAINTHFDKDGADRDGEMEDVLLSVADAVASSMTTALATIRGAIDQIMSLQLGPASKSTYVGRNYSALNRTVESDDGALTVAFKGALEDLRLASKSNNGGSTPQEVVENLLSVGAVTYESGNVGTGTTPTATAYEHQEAGTWTGVCTSETIGSEEFEMSFAPTEASRANFGYTSPRKLRIKAEWKDPGSEPTNIEDPFVGIKSLTIDRARTVTNDTGTMLDTTVTLWSETGETSTNTDDGILYVSAETNGANFDISFYKDSNKPSSALVAKATNIAASAAFTASQRNRSGLSISGTLHGSVADGNASTLNLKVFKKDGRTDGDPDRFEFAITETSAGKWQRMFRRRLGYYMHSDTAGGETIDEDFASRHSPLDLLES